MIEPSSLITYLANRTVGKHSRKIPEGAIIRDTLSFEHLDFRTDFRASLMEVARMLRVSQRTVQDWIRNGELTAVRYGRQIRVHQADIEAFGVTAQAYQQGNLLSCKADNHSAS